MLTEAQIIEDASKQIKDLEEQISTLKQQLLFEKQEYRSCKGCIDETIPSNRCEICKRTARDFYTTRKG